VNLATYTEYEYVHILHTKLIITNMASMRNLEVTRDIFTYTGTVAE